MSEESNTSLEEAAELKYKSLLVNVTRQRKKYPKSLSKLLGYTVRMEKKTIESMKVDLPFKPPLEAYHGNTGLENYNYDSYKNHLNSVVKDVQYQTSKMSKLSEALEIINASTDPWDDISGYDYVKS